MNGTPAWLAEAVSKFGSDCKDKLGVGEPEAAIRTPLENLLSTVGDHIQVPAKFHDEVRDEQRQVRPDYGVSVKGAIVGYVEVKAPGKGLDPNSLTGHDKVQWERQRDLPNLIYTNGTEWRLYRDGEPVGEPVWFIGSLPSAGATLAAPAEFETLVTDFLKWDPSPITSIGSLVRAMAALTRLLRGEVVDQLESEARAVAEGASPTDQSFTGLASDWRGALFPHATDAEFADGYAQAVVFALLLAREQGVPLEGRSLHDVGGDLASEHTLMGRALQLLTGSVAKDFKVTLDLLVRVVGVIDWAKVRRGHRDLYLNLYEHFLEQYDNELRKQSGTYYTPVEVVEPMVRMAERALETRLGKAAGFRDDSVLTVDPAMGTGTYLLAILRRVAQHVEDHDGAGSVPGALAQAAKRLVGFEIQMGPFAVAELRTTDFLAEKKVTTGGPSLYVTDTLEDPYAPEAQLGSALSMIAKSRHDANLVKRDKDVTVVIGNPPYDELTVGKGGWVESGSTIHGKKRRAILEDYSDGVAGRFKAKLKNLYVYFWRWATWKTWESTDDRAGVVCFISTAGYLTGPAFTGMRSYLRRWASEGWVIDLTPEGQTPDIPTRIFPHVRQQLAIGLFVRNPDEPAGTPAVMHVRSVSGRQAQKFEALAKIDLDDDGWQLARTDWTAPLTPAAAGEWDAYPAVDDLMPWTSPGVFPTRRWVIAPSLTTLKKRWATLLTEPDAALRSEMFKESRDATLTFKRNPLPGGDTHQHTDQPLSGAAVDDLHPIRYGYRAFDRQWIIPDSRVMDMPRPTLWEARRPGQVFVVEQHRRAIASGPALVFTALLPDYDAFRGSEGGRTLPYLHADGSANLAPGLQSVLSAKIGVSVEAADVLAYLAGVAAHRGFTARFADELTTPGVRIPITADPTLWTEAVELGREVLWLHTYGQTFTGPDRPTGDIRYPSDDHRRVQNTSTVAAPPTAMTHTDEVLTIGTGTFAPVPAAVWAYDVGGTNVLKSWFNYRKDPPGGKKTSPLDSVYAKEWDASWNSDLLDLLSVLSRLVDLEPQQGKLLGRVLDGPVLTRADLAVAGVKWPESDTDRKPHRAIASTSDDGSTLPLSALGAN